MTNVTKTTKARSEQICSAWKLQNSVKKLERQKMARMEIINDAVSSGSCVPGCDSEWFPQANDSLRKNEIEPVLFAAALRDLQKKGRGKFQNIMLIRPTNCSKTFLLATLERSRKS